MFDLKPLIDQIKTFTHAQQETNTLLKEIKKLLETRMGS